MRRRTNIYTYVHLIFAIKAEERVVEEGGLAFMRRDPPYEGNPSCLEPIVGFTGPVVVTSPQNHDVMVVASDKHKRTVFAIDTGHQISRAEVDALEAREFDRDAQLYVPLVGRLLVGGGVECIGDPRVRGFVLCRSVAKPINRWSAGNWLITVQKGLPEAVVEESYYHARGPEPLCPCGSGRLYKHCHAKPGRRRRT